MQSRISCNILLFEYVLCELGMEFSNGCLPLARGDGELDLLEVSAGDPRESVSANIPVRLELVAVSISV
jgi:hypothetical protein